MDDKAFAPVSDQLLGRMLDAGLADGYVGRVEFQDGEQPNIVDAETVLAMARELTELRRVRAAFRECFSIERCAIVAQVEIESWKIAEVRASREKLQALIEKTLAELAEQLVVKALAWR